MFYAGLSDIELTSDGAVAWTLGHLPGDPDAVGEYSTPFFDAAGNLYAFYGGNAVPYAVVSYSPTGALRWVTPIPVGGAWNLTSIAEGSDGNVYTIQDGVNDNHALHLVSYDDATGAEVADHVVGQVDGAPFT